MKSVKLQDINFVAEDLQQLAKGLLDRGMSVILHNYNKPKESYFHFSDGSNVVYVEGRRWGGLRFSSVRKGSREHGTGSSHQGYMEYIDEVNIDLAVSYLDNRYYNRYPKYKYEDMNEYLEKSAVSSVIELVEL